jgi:hypothetical protein
MPDQEDRGHGGGAGTADQHVQISREDAMLWLLDRAGQHVEVAVTVEVGGYSPVLAMAAGVVRHWRDVDPGVARLDPERRREDIAGFYHVGDEGVIDLSDPDLPVGFYRRLLAGATVEQLVIALSDDAQIVVIPYAGLEEMAAGGDV